VTASGSGEAEQTKSYDENGKTHAESPCENRTNESPRRRAREIERLPLFAETL